MKNTLGERIAYYRQELNMTQQEIADKLFVSANTISSWEMNRTKPDFESLFQLSDVLDVNVLFLLQDSVDSSSIKTEIRIPLEKIEFSNLELDLQKQSEFLGEVHQKDTYFTPEHPNFVEKEYPSQWLSIRERGNKNIINYKHWLPEDEEVNTYCEELEVQIHEADVMKKLFSILNINEIVKVDKIRRKYLYQGRYYIYLDFVEGLGYYIEISVKDSIEDSIYEYEQLLKIANRLGLNLSKIEKRGYCYQLLVKNRENN